jgi:phosphotransferase system  glucose/maltose/N-acetylglucosamine-specific IIC component
MLEWTKRKFEDLTDFTIVAGYIITIALGIFFAVKVHNSVKYFGGSQAFLAVVCVIILMFFVLLSEVWMWGFLAVIIGIEKNTKATAEYLLEIKKEKSVNLAKDSQKEQSAMSNLETTANKVKLDLDLGC